MTQFTGRPYEQEEAWINICETYNLHQTTGSRVMEELKFIFDHLTKAAKIENSTDKVRFIITRSVNLWYFMFCILFDINEFKINALITVAFIVS